MDSKKLRSRVLTYPSLLLSSHSSDKGSDAQAEQSQLTATVALELLRDSPTDSELSCIPKTKLLKVGGEENSAAEFGTYGTSTTLHI